ncbi:BLUF domain-containing protein [Shewanella sp. NIFS-20-20]|uniref:BLUF domain-containing protein n=1 Tax=Shewanella sp. NIFS-20-20 TaxID=2853806 RepID=UPI001C48AF97|nr:BLUF domain-containing protein [Shewanella sp. NIFS-20-20]MBV7316584.1 BLUF domain-containing protein [Shewanella sp. NIFS-20-20]
MGDELMMELVHCIYTRAATPDPKESDLVSLLDIARKYSAALNVTGLLVFDQGSFFQILEE